MAKSQKRYALYIRVSKYRDQQWELSSLYCQQKRLEEYLFCFEKEPIYKIYSDKGVSGKDSKRPAYQQMIGSIEEGNFEVILATEISRISRSIVDFQNFLSLCEHYGVAFISISQGLCSAAQKDKTLMGIYSVLAQYEREQISQRIKLSRQAKVRQGLYLNGFIYGYRTIPLSPGYLQIDPYEAQIVNLVYDKFLQFSSYCKVAKWLNKQGFRTREYISARGKLYPAASWSKNTIHYMLTNMTYIGKQEVAKEIINGVWEPIVAEEKWQQVQNLLLKLHRPKNKQCATHVYLLSGLLYCNYCQVKLENSAGTGKGGTKVYFYYRHPGNSRKLECPHPINIPVADIEIKVASYLISLLENSYLLSKMCKRLTECLQQEAVSHKRQIASLQTLQLESTLCFLDPKWMECYLLLCIKKLLEKGKNWKDKLQEVMIELHQEGVYGEKISQIMYTILEKFYKVGTKQKFLLKNLIKKIELDKNKVKIVLKE